MHGRGGGVLSLQFERRGGGMKMEGWWQRTEARAMLFVVSASLILLWVHDISPTTFKKKKF